MKLYQQTIKHPVTVSGIGLHTGHYSELTFMPAKENSGIKFQRTDLHGYPIVSADIENVVSVLRGTSIEQNEVRIHTIEHALAAIFGLEIDNILIEINGSEPPIMDGSSRAYMDALLSAEIVIQKELKNYLEIKEEINYTDVYKNIKLKAIPFQNFNIDITIDYDSPVIGFQQASLKDLSEFYGEFSNARTFCFLHEIEELFHQKLIKGGDFSNAIVIANKKMDTKKLDYLAKLLNKPKITVNGEGILNNTNLRYKNEPARHKLLDLVGDLSMIGRPIKGKIIASRTGHEANIAFAKIIKSMHE